MVKKYWSLTLILTLGTVLRLYHNTNISLWHDEAFSALLIRYPWSEMMYRIGLDVHPPVYYIFLRFWHYLFGDSLLALRAFTVAFGVGTIWAAYAFVKEAFKNEKAALWVAVLVALNPFQIQYATEARMYTLGAFFAVLSAYFLTKALREQRAEFSDEASLHMPHLPQDIRLNKQAIWHFLGFSASVIVMVYTHYYLLFTAAAIGFYALAYCVYHYRTDFKKYTLVICSFVLIGVAYLPWLKTFLFQYRQVGGSYWIPPMDKWSIPTTLWTVILGFGRDVGNPTTQKLLILLSLFALYVVYRFVKKTQAPEKWLVLLAVLAPFAGSALFYLLARLKGGHASVYLERYFLFTSAYFSIILGLWLKELKIKWLSASLFAVYCVLNLTAFYNYWSDLNIQSKPGMGGAVKFLQANVERQHKIYVGSSFMFFNFKYYNKTPITPLLYSGGNREVTNLPHFAGTALLTNADLLPDFNEQTKNGDTVWLIWTNGFGGSKPDTPANWTKIDEKSFAEVRPYVGTFVYVTEYKVN